MQRKLDLRTGRPVWFAYRSPSVPSAPLKRDHKTGLLVVGMGISGAMIAEALAADGHEVTCIDRRGPMKGSTPATTALVQFEIDQPLSLLSRRIGRPAAQQAWRRSRLAVGNLAARIEQLGIACNLARRQSLYLAGDVLDADGLQKEGRLREAAGMRGLFLDRKALRDRFGLSRDAALVSHDNLALDPRRLTAGLLLKAAQRGASFFSPVEAGAISHSADGVSVATKAGPVISAKHVVLATGYELADIVPPTDHQVISTWAIATRPQPKALWPSEAFVWEASDPYLYMRRTPDGRIVCGGEDEEFTDEERRDALIPEKTETIARKLAALLPGVDARPDFAWAGAFGSTPTGLPVIGSLPRRPRIHAVQGYGGNGITFSQMASEIIASALRGEDDVDAPLFAFPR